MHRQPAAVLLAALCIAGCGSSAPPAPAVQTSVDKLVEHLPGFAALGVESTAFTVTTSNTASRVSVPSPSDTQFELSGRATLSELGFAELKSAHTWRPVTHTQLPAALRATLPPGAYLISESFNATHSRHARFPKVFVAIPDASPPRAVYILARDMDHPIH